MNAVIFRDADGTWLAEWELPHDRVEAYAAFDDLTVPGRPPVGAVTAVLMENGRRSVFKQVIGAETEPEPEKPKKRGK